MEKYDNFEAPCYLCLNFVGTNRFDLRITELPNARDVNQKCDNC